MATYVIRPTLISTPKFLRSAALSVVVLVIVLFCAAPADGGSVTDGLTGQFTARGTSEALPVLISLNDPFSASDLAARLSDQQLPLEQIHQRVMDTLRYQSEILQSAVLPKLQNLEIAGTVRNIRPLWIVNAISAEITKSAVEEISAISEVLEIGLDESVMLRRNQPALVDGTVNSLGAVGALEAWMKGTKGEGRIVCVIGDGHNLNHPALAANWRGKSAPLGECWFDLSGSSPPATCGNESAYLLGLLCGTPVGSDPAVGVAPAAQWIAANVFCGGITKLSDVLFALQWAVDPDGNSRTFGDVPDAILNPWGINAECLGGEPPAIWNFISNAETLGPVLVFAANQGEQARIQSPESHVGCLSVGNVDVRGNQNQINSTSGRGPSACDGALIKPDLVAPGSFVRTTAASSGYVYITGTAAAAYVTGAIALIRETNTALSASAIKQLLISSAKDLGSTGPDHTYGHGLLDIAKAVSQAQTRENSGSVRVSVRCDGKPVNGARIILTGTHGNLSATSENGEAVFHRVDADQTYALTVGRFGYAVYTKSDPISVAKDASISVSVELKPNLEDNAESDQGWSLGVAGDNATSGIWVRAIPVGSTVNGRPVQPDMDADPNGRFCFVTGNASSKSAEASEADVDGGRTTLRSPVFDLREVESPHLGFSYWFSNDKGTNPGGDAFRVQISSDAGITWNDVLTTTSSTNGWTKAVYPLASIISPTDRMMLQFIADDSEPGSLVEAAVDAIRFIGNPTAPEPPKDLVLDVQFNQVVLGWRSSPNASAYNVYLSGNADQVVQPANLYATVPDTTLAVPMSDIPYEQFYFQVTAVK